MTQKSENKSGFAGFKLTLPDIDGISTINQRARVELGLNCSEFVLMLYVAAIFEKKRPYDWVQAFRKTGFSQEEQVEITRGLMQKGMIFPTEKDPPDVTDKWYSVFTDLEKEFMQFWKSPKGKNAWPGSKPNAYKLYHQLRKSGITFDYLMQQRKYYMLSLKYTRLNRFDRQTMMATVWLGSAERYNENWKEQYETAKAKYEASLKAIAKTKNKGPIAPAEFKKIMNK